MSRIEFRVASWVGEADGMSLDLYVDQAPRVSVFEDEESGERSVFFWGAGYENRVTLSQLEHLLRKAEKTDLSSPCAE